MFLDLRFWDAGQVNVKDAEELLMDKSKNRGTFLVRDGDKTCEYYHPSLSVIVQVHR